MNIKAQDISKIVKNVEEVFNTLSPGTKEVVVVLGTGAIFFFSVSEACKSATTFAKEGLPPMVEYINMLKLGNSNKIVGELCDTQIIDESSAA